MEKEAENKFSSGLFLGLLIGGGLAIFLNSPSGRKLLKSISQEGLDNILHLLDEDKDLDEDYEEDEVPEKPNGDSQTQPRESVGEGVSGFTRPPVRRFFRGIGKKIYNKASHL